MNRFDVVGALGLTLFVVGFGGGWELSLLAQSKAFHVMYEAGGNASPMELAGNLSRASGPLRIGILVGMVGVVLMAISLRGLLTRPERSAAIVGERGRL